MLEDWRHKEARVINIFLNICINNEFWNSDKKLNKILKNICNIYLLTYIVTHIGPVKWLHPGGKGLQIQLFSGKIQGSVTGNGTFK